MKRRDRWILGVSLLIAASVAGVWAAGMGQTSVANGSLNPSARLTITEPSAVGVGRDARGVQYLPPDADLLSAEVEAVVAGLPLEFADALWPGADAVLRNGVALGEAPSEVLQGAADWVRTVLGSAWVPAGLTDHFVAYRKEMAFIPPQTVGYLGVRYELRQNRIQVQENGAAVAVLIVPPAAETEQPSPGEYLRQGVTKYLDISAAQLASMSWSLTTTTLPSGALVHGTVGLPNLHSASRQWWHRIYCLTDGRVLYFGIAEVDESTSGRQSRPGIRSRFAVAANP